VAGLLSMHCKCQRAPYWFSGKPENPARRVLVIGFRDRFPKILTEPDRSNQRPGSATVRGANPALEAQTGERGTSDDRVVLSIDLNSDRALQ